MRWMRAGWTPAGLAVLLAVVLSRCAVNPATGERQLSLIGEGQEIAMGREADQAYAAQLGIYDDAELGRYITDLGTRLAAVSERPDLPWTFRLIDDPTVNAFALPGGFIYITRGILAHMTSEAQLATVLGHEIGHVTARHSVAQMSRAQLAQIGLVGAAIALPEAAGVLDLAGAGLGLLFLRYGRDDERQADDLGLRYMRRLNYDPREAPVVFTMLERVSAAQGAGRVPEWLSTHPSPENRAGRLRQAIAAAGEDLSGAIVRRDEFIQRLDGLVHGENPREGFFRDTRFLHPELAFEITFPAGWRTANQKQAVLAAPQARDAMMQLTLVSGATTAQQAARAFAAQEGVAAGAITTGPVGALPAAHLDFTARTQQGTVAGRATFIEYGGRVYRVLGYALEPRWSAYRPTVRAAQQSFARVTDRSVLDVQPNRLRIVRLDRAMTLREFAQRFPSVVPAEELALLNQTTVDATLPAGSRVKQVVTAAR
jgi:predicted Zn-dependent protease